MEQRISSVFDGLDKTDAETKKRIDNIREKIPLLVDAIKQSGYGMESYWNSILADIEYDRAKKAVLNAPGICVMEKALADIKLQDGQLILVHTETGTERKFVHTWAEKNNLESAPIRCNFFGSVYIYKCSCGSLFYHNEISRADYSSVTGSYIGQMISCDDCDGYYDEDPEYSDMVRKKGFNCVVIGKTLPPLSKWCTRRKRKREVEHNICKNIDLKEIKIISRKDFMEQMELFVKKQQEKHVEAKRKRREKMSTTNV